MKYIFRLIGAFILWPLLTAYILLSFIVVNTLSVIWYFNFKHLWHLKSRDFYFFMESNGSEVADLDIKNGLCEWETYELYYRTPLDMIKGKITKNIK